MSSVAGNAVSTGGCLTVFSASFPVPPVHTELASSLFSRLNCSDYITLFVFHLNNLLEVLMAFQTDKTEAENEV